MQVLQLDIKGNPQKWISPKKAATYYADDSVVWTFGDVMTELRGGTNARTGELSRIELHPIIAVNGAARLNLFDVVPSLTNRKLFARDKWTCAYCGDVYPDSEGLTRDHIVPRCQGGPDVFSNVCACCRVCNSRKAGRTPEQAGMPLLFAPYVPSVFEDFILRGRNVRGDVHAWLASRVSRGSRWALH